MAVFHASGDYSLFIIREFLFDKILKEAVSYSTVDR